jgi:Bacterial PH domain
MSYISRNVINTDERLVYTTRLHWMYLLKGLVWFAVFLLTAIVLGRLMELAGVRAGVPMTHVEILDADLGPVLWWMYGGLVGTGLMALAIHLINYFFTELAVTSSRVIYKTGMISTMVEEIGLAEIESEKVRSGWFGNLFGYGSVVLDCRFIGDVALPKIRNAYRFIRVIHKMRSELSRPSVVS